MIKGRIKKQKNLMMRYFWGAFAFHIIVYGMLSHVMIRFGSDHTILFVALAGVLITIPFTTMMMKRYKKLALLKHSGADLQSMRAYIQSQKAILLSFFQLKNRYEYPLTALQAAIGVFVLFRIFMPGGIAEHLWGALIIYGLTMLSCIAAIRLENKRSFVQPLNEMNKILNEYRD